MIIKNVFVVRHGHSDFDTAVDFKRNLTEQGQEAAKNTAGFIKKICQLQQIEIDECVCSAAVRTTQTAEILCDFLKLTSPTKKIELYTAVTGGWLDVIANSKSKSIILVGHNPTMSQLLGLFSQKQYYMNPADCGFAEIEVKSDGVHVPASNFQLYKNEH